MKSILLFVAAVLIGITATGQQLNPVFSFDEEPYNHNMHIESDGDYYYTVNGGDEEH